MSSFPITPADPTLDPALTSWLASANDPATDFPIQNLPLCRWLKHDQPEEPVAFVGVAIGDQVIDLDALIHAGVFDGVEGLEILHDDVHHGETTDILGHPTLWGDVRRILQAFLLDGHAGQQRRRLRESALIPQADVAFTLPCRIHNYTDFYASIHHARNVGSMFRPDNPLLPNYKHIPIGYHGRASTVVPADLPVCRPVGQTNTDNAPLPSFGPCKRLDYELEVGCVIGRPNGMQRSIPIAKAHESIFGLLLVNDWSARDVQAWEYQPLGPFLAKNFHTSVSPFLVTSHALAPFRTAGPAREASDPEPLPYLRGPADWGFDVNLEVHIRSAAMIKAGAAPFRLSRGNLRDMFWTFPQMIAHHTSNGCMLVPGDLLASGTVSGKDAGSRGCMLELTWQGNGADGKPLPRKPVELPTGEKRTFLEDGDEVTITGWCERPGYRRIGFGSCRAVIVADPVLDEIAQPS
ncbi:MAG: fumarylacetoacetase [Phycisphaerales bacterium]